MHAPGLFPHPSALSPADMAHAAAYMHGYSQAGYNAQAAAAAAATAAGFHSASLGHGRGGVVTALQGGGGAPGVFQSQQYPMGGVGIWVGGGSSVNVQVAHPGALHQEGVQGHQPHNPGLPSSLSLPAGATEGGATGPYGRQREVISVQSGTVRSPGVSMPVGVASAQQQQHQQQQQRQQQQQQLYHQRVQSPGSGSGGLGGGQRGFGGGRGRGSNSGR